MMVANVLDNFPGLISPVREIASYEALWTHHTTPTQIANLFRTFGNILPSAIADSEGISAGELHQIRSEAERLMPFTKYSALFYQDFEYPNRLRDAKHPVEVLYYRGNLDLLSSKAIAVVGAREASPEGIARAKKTAKLLVEGGFTVMSGLAKGIDTAAHEEAIKLGGKTIGVLGTALHESYPKQNRALQREIAKNHIIVSQVPFVQYDRQCRTNFRRNRMFFPERNKTMSALSLATIIVEAGESSGSLTQAQAAVEQGRKLFILKSCFEKGLQWPNKYLAKGAIKIEDGTEILEHLGNAGDISGSGIAVAKN
ncbi:DNA-processing protein DprA [Sphaerothrix gracilis]|uniref:DNA-processing protein DprA n=1 Tax=Sphaerothrix gracilis TaxID=3151835 RepID=UPI0031FE003F